jgi:predicted enzyme related to lactoylglutathione lyase
MTRFERLTLRTTDVAAARRFYDAVLGASSAGVDGARDIEALPEQALARGARPHWLGSLGVADVEASAQALVARGAMRLGPTQPVAGGTRATVRDAGGAVVAVANGAPGGCEAVRWYALNSHDGAMTTYAELFGWEARGELDLGPHGVHRLFAWAAGGEVVGSIGSIAGRPGVHPHWLFSFGVAALEPALAAVRAHGGVALPPIVLPSGERVVACDDPQGAAFGLRC